MKIAFLKPPIGGILGLEMLTFVEPLGPICVAACLEADGHECKVIDLRIDGEQKGMEICRRFGPDVVGLQCNFTTERNRTVRLARQVRAMMPHAFVVVGGHDASRDPDFFRNDAVDAIAVGDGEEVMPPLVDALKRGADLHYADHDYTNFRRPRRRRNLQLHRRSGLGPRRLCRLRNWIEEMNTWIAGFSILTPLPGTDLWDAAKNNVTTHKWEMYDIVQTVLPTRLPLEEFYEEYSSLWRHVLRVRYRPENEGKWKNYLRVAGALATGKLSLRDMLRGVGMAKRFSNPQTFLKDHHA